MEYAKTMDLTGLMRSRAVRARAARWVTEVHLSVYSVRGVPLRVAQGHCGLVRGARHGVARARCARGLSVPVSLS